MRSIYEIYANGLALSIIYYDQKGTLKRAQKN